MIDDFVTFLNSYYTHKLILESESLLEEGAGALIVREKTGYTTILEQNDEHIIPRKLTMQLLTNHREDAGMFTTHIHEVTDVIKTTQTGNTQHRPYSFSTSQHPPDSPSLFK